MIPVYKDLANAIKKHPDATVFINFASFRSAYTTTMEALQHSDVLKVITIIAEGLPEQQTRKLIREAERRGVMIIGPATVGGIVPGSIRLGNTGGMIDNVIAARLYRPGSVAYVSRSGGMSNELNNIISRHSDGVREGIAIGGDRYPGTRFIDHLLRYQADPEVKILCLLGEVGGMDEYDVIKAVEDKRITKPLIAWTIGTCASSFGFEVQFGHAGALAQKERETAVAKNQAFIKCGAHVPKSFATYGEVLEKVFKELVAKGLINQVAEPSVPKVPMDFQWAKRLGLVRKPAAFVSTISDDRGEELVYAGMPISKVMEEDMGIGGVLGLLWFKRRLPPYACKFIETVLMITADHGPAVSGAHNTIVCARAGKGLVESLASGLLCIGPRFGGALDDAAQMFMKASDRGVSARDWVNELKNNNELIMGIGHKVKSVNNPDKRVQIVVEFAKANFPATPVLDFALEVEKLTTKKRANLILNVDGAVACAFVDMMRLCGAFTREEADEAVVLGTLNGLFVVGRSIGFVGHFLDQTRLKQGLYRHPVDDIAYSLPTFNND
jgi:ATP citrate (pro-S)-lyase